MVLDYLARLYEAIRARNELRVHALLREPESLWIPREVREEAIVMVRLPAASMRAPMQLLMFLHRMEQLTLLEPVEDENAPRYRDPNQLDLPLAIGDQR